VITPFSVLMSFMGVPAGFILARTRKYKWMFITGYAIMVAAMFGLVSLGQATGIGWSIAISVAVGIGIGTIPTINALVVQAAVPREMLGAATGGLYFFVTLGKAIAPALLGSAMNTSYTRVFNASLPTSLQSSLDKAGMVSLGDPKVLLSPTTITDLQTALDKLGDQAAALFDQVLQSIRHSLDSALNTVFLIGAVLMLISFIIIITVPEIPLEEVKKQEENPSAPNG
jgi:MFS family permease